MQRGKESAYRRGLTGFLDNIVFTLNQFNVAAGRVAISATPLMAGLCGACAVSFAIFENVLLISADWWIAVVAATIAGGAIEGINFASVASKDRAETHNRAVGDGSVEKLSIAVVEALVSHAISVTFLIVLVLESAPSAVSWYMGDMDTQQAMFRVGLMAMPFLSRIGARLYSFASQLDAVDQSGSVREVRDAKAAKMVEVANAELAVVEAKRKAEEARAENARKAEEARAERERVKIENMRKADEDRELLRKAKHEARMAKVQKEAKVVEEAEEVEAKVEEAPKRPRRTKAKVRPVNSAEKAFERRIKIVDAIKSDPELTISAIARMVKSSPTTVTRDVNWLVTNEVMDKKNGEVNGEPFFHVNGKEEAFRSGQL